MAVAAAAFFNLLPSISLLSLLLILSSISSTIPNSAAESTTTLHLANETLEWQFQSNPAEFVEEDGVQRRSLFWGTWPHRRYYISYGALSANRVPCPPRSGRSYYTHNCYGARGPVHPYTRGCSAITRCRR